MEGALTPFTWLLLSELGLSVASGSAGIPPGLGAPGFDDECRAGTVFGISGLTGTAVVFDVSGLVAPSCSCLVGVSLTTESESAEEFSRVSELIGASGFAGESGLLTVPDPIGVFDSAGVSDPAGVSTPAGVPDSAGCAGLTGSSAGFGSAAFAGLCATGAVWSAGFCRCTGAVSGARGCGRACGGRCIWGGEITRGAEIAGADRFTCDAAARGAGANCGAVAR